MEYDNMNGVDYMFFCFLSTYSILGAVEPGTFQAHLLPLLLAGAGATVCLAILLLLPFWLHHGRRLLGLLFSRFSTRRFAADESWEEALERTGFAYDPMQDIFYSIMNPWQRNYGYCQLYDEASAPLSMIIDCEPIRFEYANKKWLIELWKGQYGMTTGGEVGVYNTEEPDLNIKRFFTGTFYNSAGDNDTLPITFTLLKDNRPLFSRSRKHWWLTGFVLGEFSEPSQLRMEIKIMFKDRPMASAFVNALKELGYSSNEYLQNSNLVRLTYGTPHSSQPISRTEATDWITQRKNELLCTEYQNLTKEYSRTPDKLEFIRNEHPRMFGRILKMGKTKPLYKKHKKIQKYMDKSKSN